MRLFNSKGMALFCLSVQVRLEILFLYSVTVCLRRRVAILESKMQMANQTEVHLKNEHKLSEELMAKDKEIRVRWIASSCLVF
jgi:hypothetical protein